MMMERVGTIARSMFFNGQEDNICSKQVEVLTLLETWPVCPQ